MIRLELIIRNLYRELPLLEDNFSGEVIVLKKKR